MSPEHIDEVEFIIFDTETTGLDPARGDRIVEIAGMRIKGERILGSYESLMNPERPVSRGAFNVHGISDDRLREAPLAGEVIPAFLKFVSGAVLCSYNAPFDVAFLNAELLRMGESALTNIPTLDILRMARRMLPDIQRYSLWYVAYALGIRQDQVHRAQADVDLTWKVFRRFLALLKEKGVDDLRKIASLFAINDSGQNETRERTLATIQEAISMGAKLKVEYLSSTGMSVTHRDVVPKEIRKRKSEWYLLGYCCLRSEERAFRVDGILHMEII